MLRQLILLIVYAFCSMFPTIVNGIALNKTKNERLRSLTLNLKKVWKLCVSSMFYIDDVDCISPRIFKFDPSTAVCSKQRKPGN